jgi:hypothetical protein
MEITTEKEEEDSLDEELSDLDWDRRASGAGVAAINEGNVL